MTRLIVCIVIVILIKSVVSNDIININDYLKPTDSDTFENSIANRDSDGIILITPRTSDIDTDRDYWLIDRATGDGSKILANPCTYEIEDLCKTAEWIPKERKSPEKISFMDRHDHSYGTDAGTDESQYGDWRGIGVLFANVECFSIKNLHIVESHGWGISLEECSNGSIEKICFNACMSKLIDGLRNNMENQDGIDIRNGCRDILISDITGKTGDDVVALTAIADKEYRPGGSLRNTHVMHNDWTKREQDIHDITIRNITAYSDLCFTVRLLPAMTRIWNIIIDGVIDNTPVGHTHGGTLLLGDEGGYGENLPDSCTELLYLILFVTATEV